MPGDFLVPEIFSRHVLAGSYMRCKSHSTIQIIVLPSALNCTNLHVQEPRLPRAHQLPSCENDDLIAGYWRYLASQSDSHAPQVLMHLYPAARSLEQWFLEGFSSKFLAVHKLPKKETLNPPGLFSLFRKFFTEARFSSLHLVHDAKSQTQPLNHRLEQSGRSVVSKRTLYHI